MAFVAELEWIAGTAAENCSLDDSLKTIPLHPLVMRMEEFYLKQVPQKVKQQVWLVMCLQRILKRFIQNMATGLAGLIVLLRLPWWCGFLRKKKQV